MNWLDGGRGGRELQNSHVADYRQRLTAIYSYSTSVEMLVVYMKIARSMTRVATLEFWFEHANLDFLLCLFPQYSLQKLPTRVLCN